jgi:DNA-binding beta-propeller fold protein YncE
VNALRRGTLALAVLLLIVTAVALGPTLLRTDHVRYEWAGSFGEEVLEEPLGITRIGDRLFVTDAARNAVVVFDTTGTLLTEWNGDSQRFLRPMNVHRAAPGPRLLVAEFLSDRVTVLDTAGRIVSRVGGATGSAPGELDAPGGAADAAGETWVADFYNHRVHVFQPDGGVRILGRPGRILPGRLHYPTDIAVAGDSVAYVADGYNHRVQAFDAEGRRLRTWGGPLGTGIPGGLRGWFRVVTGIEVARDTVYVADFYNHRIQIFSLTGRYLGQAADSLHLPTSAVPGEYGDLYVVDFGNSRVARFKRLP